MSTGLLHVAIRRQLRVNRVSLTVMTTFMALFNVVQLEAYVTSFPTVASRQRSVVPLGHNGALRALYGYPYDLASPAGWVAWRGMSNVAVIMAGWAAFIVVGALRGEEEARRAELSLSQPLGRRRWFSAALLAVAGEAVIIGGASVLSLAAAGAITGDITAMSSLELGLQVVAPAFVFGAVAAVASQLVGTARGARIACGAVIGVAFLLRAAADTGPAPGWVRWLTPLGWVEEIHPPAPPSPGALIAVLITCAALIAAALTLLTGRDIGLGVLHGRDRRPPRLALLGSSWTAALRDELPGLGVWLSASVAYSLLLGGLITSALALVRSTAALRSVAGGRVDATAFIAVMFGLVQLVAALLVATMITALWKDEGAGRLELLLAGPRSRVAWLAARTLLAAGAAVTLSMASAVALWLGAHWGGTAVGLAPVLEAGINCVPIIVITAGAAIALFGLAPRALAAALYPCVAVVYLWDAVGSLLKAPAWALDISPLHDLARVPLEDFAVLPAMLITAVGLTLWGAGAAGFRRRDLLSF